LDLNFLEASPQAFRRIFQWKVIKMIDNLRLAWYIMASKQGIEIRREEMTLKCSFMQSITLRQRLALRECIGETSGDIPLYSLHRIRALLRKHPISVSEELRTLLMRNLIAANRGYKAESGNDWSCLTSRNLVDAIEVTDREITETIDRIYNIPKEFAVVKGKLFAKLHEGRKRSVRTMQQWFEANFQDLLYDMRGKIPWPIVLRLRRNLGAWIATAANPFNESIEDMILEVAAQEGVVAGSAEDAWKSMGGAVFDGEKDRTT
jgi:hypothetical protein